MSLRCTVRVALNDAGEARARAVMEALGPDNSGFPDGVSMEMLAEKGCLVLLFRGEGDAGVAGALASTIDDALGHAQVALGVTE